MAQLIGGPHDGAQFTAGGNNGWIGLPLSTTPQWLEAIYGYPVARYTWCEGAWRFTGFLPASKYRGLRDLENIMYGSRAKAGRSLFSFFGGKS